MKQNIRKAEELLSDLKDVEKAMVAEMCALKNASWLEEGEAEIGQKEFANQTALADLNVFEEGSAELYYTVNDLFWGHEIQVSLNQESQYESATLVG